MVDAGVQPFSSEIERWLGAGGHEETMPREVRRTLDMEEIAIRYGVLPSAVAQGPVDNIRHFRLMKRLEEAHAELAGDEEA